jgi:histidinol-phosphate aminotransferase
VIAARLARPEVRNLRPYTTARQEPGTLRLNANEAPSPAGGDRPGLNRYPPIRPQLLRDRLADYFGVSPDNLLATRGASEGIDLLVRTFCRPGSDNILITPPTFAMYRVYADMQAAGVVAVPLARERDFGFDVQRVLAGCDDNTRLVFVCSPNNPTGGPVSRSDILQLAEARKARSIVVVDEAYVEFSGADSLAKDAERLGNLVVLRTLSKALALAGARCGAVIGPAELVQLVGALLAPYAIATPVIDCVLEALAPRNLQRAQASIEGTIRERERLCTELARHPLVRKVWPSRANFLLVQFTDPVPVREALRERRILIREFEDDEDLADCARITVGSRDDNDRLLRTLAAIEEAA